MPSTTLPLRACPSIPATYFAIAATLKKLKQGPALNSPFLNVWDFVEMQSSSHTLSVTKAKAKAMKCLLFFALGSQPKAALDRRHRIVLSYLSHLSFCHHSHHFHIHNCYSHHSPQSHRIL